MKLSIKLTPEMRTRLMHAETIEIEVPDSTLQDLPHVPDEIDFDVEFENGDYDRDDEQFLRGRVEGWNDCCREFSTRASKSKGNSI
ncbi:MAG: hypothetical protein E7L31_07260 [Aeromonas sp.]|nr:hypothetical protein [Aeromonas sp.]